MRDGETTLAPARSVGRRGMVGMAAAGAVAAGLRPAPALAGIPPARRLSFEVTRNGRPIGSHVVSFEQVGAKLEVRVEVDLEVRWAGLVMYRYRSRAAETWQDNRLVAAHSETTDDYGNYAMRAARRDGRLVVEGTHGATYTAPDAALVSSHWNAAQLDAPMISLQDGKLLAFRIDPKGRATIAARGAQVEAEHFALSGPHTLELWYDRNRVWSKLRAVSWEGSLIQYRKI
jgi:hypothetical protein